MSRVIAAVAVIAAIAAIAAVNGTIFSETKNKNHLQRLSSSFVTFNLEFNILRDVKQYWYYLAGGWPTYSPTTILCACECEMCM